MLDFWTLFLISQKAAHFLNAGHELILSGWATNENAAARAAQPENVHIVMTRETRIICILDLPFSIIKYFEQ